MGVNLSKKETAVEKFEDSDNDVGSGVRDPRAVATQHHQQQLPPTERNNNNTNHINNRVGRREEEKKPGRTTTLSLLGNVFGKGKPRIIDLDSSGSDTEYEDEYQKSLKASSLSRKKELDPQLRNVISELENTLNNLGLDDQKQDHDKSFQKREGRVLGWSREGQEEGSRVHPSRPRGHQDHDEEEEEENHREVGLQAFSSRDGADIARLMESRGELTDRRRGVRRGQSMKFTWDDRRFAELEEDWTLSKVKIDGFDPEKFRRANSTAKPPEGGTTHQDIFILKQKPNNAIHYEDLSVPGSVPAYDPIEQQILASIERELGVL